MAEAMSEPRAVKLFPSIGSQSIESYVKLILQKAGLYELPVPLIQLARETGVHLHNAVFTEPDVVCIIAKKRDTVRLFATNQATPYEKRVIIAHCLGHFFLHIAPTNDQEIEFRDSKWDLLREAEEKATHEGMKRISKEIFANRFATELLMPKDLVSQQFRLTRDLDLMAQTFQVTPEAMVNRIQRLLLI